MTISVKVEEWTLKSVQVENTTSFERNVEQIYYNTMDYQNRINIAKVNLQSIGTLEICFLSLHVTVTVVMIIQVWHNFTIGTTIPREGQIDLAFLF